MGRRVARRKEKKKNQHLKSKITCAVIVLVCLVYIISCIAVPKSRIIKGVVMNGVKLSGCTKQEAEKKLNEQFKKDYKDITLKVKAIDEEKTVSMYSALSFDAEKAAEKAFSYGHSHFLLRGIQKMKAGIVGKKMTYYPDVDDKALEEAVTASGIPDVSTTTQTTYELEDNELQITMGKSGKSVDLDELYKQIKKAVSKNDYKTVIEASTVKGKVAALNMDDVYKEVHKDKVEATLDKNNDNKLVKSVTGIDFDKDSAQKVVDEAKEGEVVHIEIVKDEPEMTTSNLKKHLFEKSIGKCSTDVEGKASRVSNIKKCAKVIDGTVLLAGESFSFNDIVGKRTTKRGYKDASVYYDGRSGTESGGGIVQVASTIYKAAVLANLKITEHHTNTYVTSYLGAGMDASVAWDKQDLAFTNDTDYPVKILVDYEDGKLTCKIKGAKISDNKIEFTTETLSTEKYGKDYQESDKMYKGESKILQSGENGCTVQTYRVTKDKNGQKISSEKLDKCKYSARDEIVVKGTKAKPAATTAATTETKPATSKTKKATPAG